jgi:hypothetical protein
VQASSVSARNRAQPGGRTYQGTLSRLARHHPT